MLPATAAAATSSTVDDRPGQLVDDDRRTHLAVAARGCEERVEHRSERESHREGADRFVASTERAGAAGWPATAPPIVHLATGRARAKRRSRRGETTSTGPERGPQRAVDALRPAERAESGDEVDHAVVGAEIRHGRDDQEQRGGGEEHTGLRPAEVPRDGHGDGHGEQARRRNAPARPATPPLATRVESGWRAGAAAVS